MAGTMQREWDMVLNDEFGRGHAVDPPFAPYKVGDYGKWKDTKRIWTRRGSVRWKKLRATRGATDLEIASDCEVRGAFRLGTDELPVQGGVAGGEGSVKFTGKNGFYLYTPESRGHEAEDNLALAQAVFDDLGGDVDRDVYIIYAIEYAASGGMWTGSQEKGSETGVDARYTGVETGTLTGSFALTTKRGSSEKVSYEGDMGPYLFKMLRFTLSAKRKKRGDKLDKDDFQRVR